MSEEKEINQNQEQQSYYNYPDQGYYPQQLQQTYGFYPMYPAATRQMAPPQQPAATHGMLPLQQSYIENILRLNRGKMATVHMTFEGNNSRTFTGIIEAAGRDHIILSEEGTNRRVLLLMVYLDYVTFNEEINYDYPFAATGQQLASFAPR